MKVLARNKRAGFDFDIAERLVAGLVLTGSEVKSIKNGHVSLKGSYITFSGGEPYLTSAHVSPYQPAAIQHEPRRERKLLLRQQEIKRLAAAKQNGQHIVPTKIGLERGLVKLEIGIGTARKKHDKRQRLKERDSQREIDRRLKRPRP